MTRWKRDARELIARLEEKLGAPAAEQPAYRKIAIWAIFLTAIALLILLVGSQRS